jgi:hypothetical protein
MQLFQSILSFLGVTGLYLPTEPKILELSYPSVPLNHPASVQFTAWLVAFNTGDKKTLLEYHSGPDFLYSIASQDIANILRESGLAIASGGFNVAEVESSSEPSTVVVVLKEKNREQYARASMVVDISKPNYPVTEFDMHPIITPIKFIPKDGPRRVRYEKALKPLTTPMRRAVVDGISDVLREQYVHPDLVEHLASALETHFYNGDYDSFVESEKFAGRLTADLHAAGHDKGIMIHFIDSQGQRPGHHDGRHGPPNILEYLRQMNFGFGSISLDKDTVPGKTIATLPINTFVLTEKHFSSDWEEIQGEIGKILSTVADADALLIDLRHNNGGSPNGMAFVLSYLLDDGPIHISNVVDRNGKVERTFSTLPVDELPAGTRAFGGTKPLFVLTTNQTLAGGEEMAYGLQAFNRSGAVIGEGNKATAGFTNMIMNPRFICEEIFGKRWWLVIVPTVRPVHAVTGKNWEGVGVISDVVAGSGEWEEVTDALEVGTRLAKLALQMKEPQGEL